MILKNATIFDQDFNRKRTDIKVEGKKIVSIGDYSRYDGVDMTGCLIAPGLIDVHIHGCNGGDFCEGTAGMTKMSDWLITKGITSFCGTTMTLGNEALTSIVADAKAFVGNEAGAKLIGINLEGPFISATKKGAQNEAYIRGGSLAELKQLHRSSGEMVKLIDIAPEAFNSDEFIKEASQFTTVSIGHSNATAEESKKAFALGVTHVTHLFNAMTTFNHREAGIIGAAFDDDKVTCELICDGHHVSPLMIRVALRQLGEDRVVVISDSMKAAGSHEGQYELGGQAVIVRDGLARLIDGTIAASISNIYDEFKNLLSFGIAERVALKACTINPAKAIKMDASIGSIAIGKDADFVVFDDAWNIQTVLLKGVFCSPWQH